MDQKNEQKAPLRIKNLAELKRCIRPGTELVATSHSKHPTLVGLVRVVTEVQTNAYYSVVKDQPTHQYSTCNYGKGFRSDFEKASNYLFEGTTIKVLDRRSGDNSVLYEMELYEKGEDGKPKIIQEQADVVRSIYDQYLSGASLRMIKDRLEAEQIPNVTGGSQWTITAIRSILTNEKYCGDVLLQKTYISDCISRKVIRNTGQLPMYLVQNHHEGIVERKTFDAVQAEMARRSAGKSPSKKNAPTGMTSYASKYALSERLVCGECGTLYRRCTWSKQGRKRVVWRCVSRLDYGTKYCHNSPTLDEEPLQKAILAAINSVMSEKSTLIRQITSAMEMELAPVPGESMSLADIERRLGELNDQTRELVAESARVEDATACTAQLRAIMNEAAILKEKRALIEEQRQSNAQAVRRIEDAAAAMAQASTHISEWDEALIRQLVDTVKVNSAEKITVFLRGGVQVEQGMI